jgi:ubiquinone/menaquinone biosynthesis C-methylase UbiE
MSERDVPGGWLANGNRAQAYEHYLVPDMYAPWAEQLVDRLALDPSDSVLDVACGTGIVARVASSRLGPGGRVVGLDWDDEMLEVARSVSWRARPAIEWRKGDATDMPFPDGRFDAVLCQQALQFFSDPDAALGEMARVLGAGGRAGLAVWRSIDHNPAYLPLADAVERYAGRDAGDIVRSAFPGWDRDQLHALVRGAGFRDVHVGIGIGTMRYPSPAEFLRREAAGSGLAAALDALGDDDLAALVKDLAVALRPYTDDDGLVFPMETYLIVGRC